LATVVEFQLKVLGGEERDTLHRCKRFPRLQARLVLRHDAHRARDVAPLAGERITTVPAGVGVAVGTPLATVTVIDAVATTPLEFLHRL